MPYDFPYNSQCTFLKVPSATAEKKDDHQQRAFAVGGIPWDCSVTNRPGARFGPSGVRLASHMLCDGIHPDFDNTPCTFLEDVGDLQIPNTSLEKSREVISELVPPLLEKYTRNMVWLGGDHSVTLPLLRCYHKQLQTVCSTPCASVGEEHQPPSTAAHDKIAVIHFDAHCDTWKDHFDEPSGHGTWVYEAIQEGIAKPECFFQFGIRSSGVKEAREYVQDQGGMIFTGKQLRGKDGVEGLSPIVQQVVDRLADHGNPPVYFTIDIDCLDPAFAPGTGTPEPGGLSSTQLLTFVELFSQKIPNFIGMDLVEVAPAYDHCELTTNVAATVMWTYLCGRGKRLEL